MGDSPFDGADETEPNIATPLVDERPRLRLHHLLVLTAVMAVLLAINGPQRDYGNYKPPGFFRILSIALGTAHTLLSATALTALGYGIAWYRRGTRFFDQPGHWLLVDISIGALLYIVPSVVFRSAAMVGVLFIGYAFLIIAVARMIFQVYFGIKKCRERRWKSVFYIKAIANLFFGFGSLFVLFAIAYALRVDRTSQTARDQGHWYGVWLQLALASLSLISSGLMAYNFFFSAF